MARLGANGAGGPVSASTGHRRRGPDAVAARIHRSLARPTAPVPGAGRRAELVVPMTADELAALVDVALGAASARARGR